MKKTLSLILVLALALSLALSLSSCSHTHTYAAAWTSDENHHWHACTGDGCEMYAEIGAHTFDQGTVITTATRQETGEKRYTCTVCGWSKTAAYSLSTTVKAGEFAAAFDFGDNYTVSLTITAENLTQTSLYACNGNILRIRTTNPAYDEESDLYEETAYTSVEGETCYKYGSHYESGNFVGYLKTVDTEKTPANWSEKTAAEILFPELCNFSLFTYNSTTKTYQAASVSLADGTATLTGISLAFTEGRLVACSLTKVSEGDSMQFLYLFTYGDAPTLSLPKNLVSPN